MLTNILMALCIFAYFGVFFGISYYIVNSDVYTNKDERS